MLIRCSKESHHPAEWVSGPPVEHQENKKDTTLMAIRVGSKYCSYVQSPTPTLTQTLNNLFQTLQIKWEVYFVKEVFTCRLLLRQYVYNSVSYLNITQHYHKSINRIDIILFSYLFWDCLPCQLGLQNTPTTLLWKG